MLLSTCQKQNTNCNRGLCMPQDVVLYHILVLDHSSPCLPATSIASFGSRLSLPLVLSHASPSFLCLSVRSGLQRFQLAQGGSALLAAPSAVHKGKGNCNHLATLPHDLRPRRALKICNPYYLSVLNIPRYGALPMNSYNWLMSLFLSQIWSLITLGECYTLFPTNLIQDNPVTV